MPVRWTGRTRKSMLACSHPMVREWMQSAEPCEWGVDVPPSANPDAIKGSQYIVPPSRKRALEKMTNFPLGLHVTGDAACALNPIFGQGRTQCRAHSRERAAEDDIDAARIH